MVSATVNNYDQPIFSSAKKAVERALSYNWTVDRPAMNKMAAPSGGSGGMGGGMEGAGMAGMILGAISRLPRPQGEILIARCAPRSFECACRSKCCSGHKPNPAHAEAIDTLTEIVIVELSGCLSNVRLRRAIVSKYFGARVSVSGLAKKYGVHPDTAGTHNAKIVRALRRGEAMAWAGIEEALLAMGVI